MKLVLIRGGLIEGKGERMNYNPDNVKAMMVRGVFCVCMKSTQFDPFDSGWDELPQASRDEWVTVANNLFNMIRGQDSDDTLEWYIKKNVRGEIRNMRYLLVFLRRVFVIASSSSKVN